MDGFKEKACKGKEETAILYMIEGEIMRIRGSLEQAICIVDVYKRQPLILSNWQYLFYCFCRCRFV